MGFWTNLCQFCVPSIPRSILAPVGIQQDIFPNPSSSGGSLKHLSFSSMGLDRKEAKCSHAPLQLGRTNESIHGLGKWLSWRNGDAHRQALTSPFPPELVISQRKDEMQGISNNLPHMFLSSGRSRGKTNNEAINRQIIRN
jgi:hypothetical protein